MLFCEKLHYLMNMFSLSNKGLGQAIHVDPSLISRWRNGKRRPAANSCHIRNISDCFAMLSVTDYQKASITAAMGLPLGSSGSAETSFSDKLYRWLLQQSSSNNDSTGAVGSLLSEVNMWDDDAGAALDRPNLLGLVGGIPDGTIRSSEAFQGKQGLCHAILKLIHVSYEAGEALRSVMVISDEGLDWFYDLAPGIGIEWTKLLHHALSKYPTYLVFHTAINNLQDTLSSIERTLPLYVATNISLLYCPHHFENAFHNLIICVSGVGAIVGHYLKGMEEEACYQLFLNADMVAYYENICHHYIGTCRPLIQTFSIDQIRQFYKFQEQFFLHNSPNISLLHTFSSVTMPYPIFEQSLEQLHILGDKRDNAQQMYRAKRQGFLKNLQYSRYTEIIMLPEITEENISRIPLNLSPYFCDQPLYYNKTGFCGHIRHIVDLLNSYDNYEVLLKKKKTLDYIQLMVKEDTGVVFTKEYKPFLTFALTQPNMTAAFYNYLYALANTIPTQERNKKQVISKLEQYIRILGK